LDNGTDPIAVVTTTRTGLTPKLNGNATTFLDGTGAFSTPAGGGNMNTSVYDTNANGVVDTCDSLAWGKLTSVPSSFNPSAHASTHTPSGSDPIAFSAGFISKIGTYTLVPQDSNKYIICSLGSWTLYLPSAAAGLTYFVRNDQGIAIGSTTGTITVSPSSGTIDGKASLALLPQQECRIFCDGTNWRTFGLQHEVLLGTQDITTSTAGGSVQLPVGYRYFELIWNSVTPVFANDTMNGRLSNDGGNTWQSGTNYFDGIVFASSQTAVAYSQLGSGTYMRLMTQASGFVSPVRLLIWPGSSTRAPNWICDSGGYNNSTGVVTTWRTQGFFNASLAVNALQYYCPNGNINNSLLTVKGVV
jgi:hypothetical protein